MCIGLPMQVVEAGDGFALCEGMGISRRVDTLLTGPQPAGTWLLIFLDSAREVLSEQDAANISAAVRAVEQVMSGNVQDAAQSQQQIDSLFADLIDNPASKPPSLLALEQERAAAASESQRAANKKTVTSSGDATVATPGSEKSATTG